MSSDDGYRLTRHPGPNGGFALVHYFASNDRPVEARLDHTRYELIVDALEAYTHMPPTEYGLSVDPDLASTLSTPGPIIPELDESELRKTVYAEVSATLNDRVSMYEADTSRRYPCEIRELRMLANAYRTYAEGVGVPSYETLRLQRGKRILELEAEVKRLRTVVRDYDHSDHRDEGCP